MRTLARNVGERAVVQDHIGGHRLRSRFRQPPRFQAQKELSELLTQRQEAGLVMMGILE